MRRAPGLLNGSCYGGRQRSTPASRGPVSCALVAVVAAAALSIQMSMLGTSVARSQASDTAGSYPQVVNPFFEVAVWKPGSPKTLVRLHILGLPSGERVISQCSACGHPRFRLSTGSDRATLHMTPRVHMTPSTRVIVGATAPGEVGRWIVIGFRRGQYRGLHHGCMPPAVRSLSPAEAAEPSRIPVAQCAHALSPPGTEYVLWQGTDGQLWQLVYNGRSWGVTLPVGSGRLGSPPTVVIRAGGQRDVFWKGTNGGLWEMVYTGFWNAPVHLRRAGKLGTEPSAMVDPRNVVHVFWGGTRGPMWEMSNRGGVWSGATPLNSGRVTSAPAAVAGANGGTDLFWKGTDSRLWEMQYRGGWQKAAKLSGAGRLASPPTAVEDTNGLDHVFWKGTNGWLWELSNPNGHWGTSQLLKSGPLGSPPSAVVYPDGHQAVFWKGNDGHLRVMVSRTGGWRAPVNLRDAGKLGSKPAAALGR